MTLDKKDEKLIEQASSIIKKCYKKGFHHIGAALRTQYGKHFSAVHIEANVGRIAVCAGGMAAAEGDTEIGTIVAAVNSQGEVVSPYGMCRE